MACTTARTVETKQQPCRRECMLLGKRANNGMSISFSHIRNHKVQQVNLQWKRVFWPEGNCMVRLRLSTKAIKTLKTKVHSAPWRCSPQSHSSLFLMVYSAAIQLILTNIALWQSLSELASRSGLKLNDYICGSVQNKAEEAA